MWPTKPITYVRLQEDENGQHFGMYIKNSLVSVISLFFKDSEVQFRKFATLPEHQGNGYGTLLLSYVFDDIHNLNVKKIWCNARMDKISFYKRFGMTTTAKRFKRSGVSYVVMEYSKPKR